MKQVLLFFIALFYCTTMQSQCWRILECGANNTVAIHQNGTLWAWGTNSQGNVGDGTTTNRSIPTQISSATNWKAISSGHGHSLALKEDGTIWSWGESVHGALGLGNATGILVPTQIGTESNYVSISAGSSISFAIKSDGTLWGWGVNLHGNVGDGTLTPKLIPTKVNNDTNWKIVNSGQNYTAAIKTDGTLWTWGSYNNHGELGNGTTYSSNFIPTKVGTDTNWAAVSTESSVGIGLKTDGTIWGWGTNSLGILGLPTQGPYLSPVQLGTDSDWKMVDCGNNKSFFLKNNGTLWATGNPLLGNGTTSNSPVIIQIGTDSDWKTISSQLFQTIGLKNDGTGYGWGSNYFGQIGNGYFDNVTMDDPTDYTLPVKIICPCLDEQTPIFSIPTNLCSGDAAPLLPLISSNAISGTWNPSTINNLTSGDYTFTPDPTAFSCAKIITIPISVATIETPTFGTIPATFCQFSIPTQLPTQSTNEIPILGIWNPESINTTVVGETTYTFIPNAGQCVTAQPIQITINIDETIVSDFAELPSLCVGDAAPILLTQAPNGVLGVWTPNTVSNSTSGDYIFTPTTNLCYATQTLHVEVKSQKQPNFADLSVCSNNPTITLQQISPNGISGKWTPSTINYNASGTYIFTPNTGQCAGSQTITISVDQPVLVNLTYTVSDAFSDNQIITVIPSPAGYYLYKLDNGSFQSSAIFTNISTGFHSIEVMDIDGCSAVTVIKDILAINYPKFFSPNGDGYNDSWTIKYLDKKTTKLRIFDRYGKLLFDVKNLNYGWDGTYNGKLMPATDYWFTVEYFEDNISKLFRSHFSLIR